MDHCQLVCARGAARGQACQPSPTSRARRVRPRQPRLTSMLPPKRAPLGLPDVGLATAKKIMTGRPYGSVSDLSKAGVPAKTIENITALASVGAATGSAVVPAPAATAPAVTSSAKTSGNTSLPVPLSGWVRNPSSPPSRSCCASHAAWRASESDGTVPSPSSGDHLLDLATDLVGRRDGAVHIPVCQALSYGGEHRRKIVSGEALSRLGQGRLQPTGSRHYPLRNGQERLQVASASCTRGSRCSRRHSAGLHECGPA